MLISFEDFKTRLESFTPEKLELKFSKLYPEYWRIIPENSKHFLPETIAYFHAIKNDKCIADQRCCHFYVGEHNKRKGLVNIKNGTPKKTSKNLRENNTSVYIRKYGKTLKNISAFLKLSEARVRILDQNGTLKEHLA